MTNFWSLEDDLAQGWGNFGYQILQTSSWIKNQSLQAMMRVAYSLGNKVFFLFSLVSLAILLLKQH